MHSSRAIQEQVGWRPDPHIDGDLGGDDLSETLWRHFIKCIRLTGLLVISSHVW